MYTPGIECRRFGEQEEPAERYMAYLPTESASDKAGPRMEQVRYGKQAHFDRGSSESEDGNQIGERKRDS